MRLVLAFPLASVPIGSLGAVEKWGRHIVSLSNRSYLGNPFLLEVDAVFTHSSSGKTVNLPGYYAGNHTWKIAFMPTLVGEWTYETASADRDLDGVTGSLESVASDRLGLLSAARSNSRKWKYQDGPLVIPVGVFVQLMLEDASPAQIAAMADFLRSKNVQLVNFRLSENDHAFSSVRGLRMNVAAWDRLEQRMETLASRGIRANVMLYTDDSGSPHSEAVLPPRISLFDTRSLGWHPFLTFFSTPGSISPSIGQCSKSTHTGRWFGRWIRTTIPSRAAIEGLGQTRDARPDVQ
jgi:hypothetical protein